MKWVLPRAGPLPCNTVACLTHHLWPVLVSQLAVRWKKAACSAQSLAQSWMAWQGKCQPEPNPGELGFLWKKAKYGFVPAASRPAHYSYVCVLAHNGGKSVVNMWPAGKERCSIRKTWKQKSLESKSSGPTCPRVTVKQRKSFSLSHSTSTFCIRKIANWYLLFNLFSTSHMLIALTRLHIR